MKAVVRQLHRLFIDPLSVKELSGISRRWQMYIGRCLYILLIAFILWLFWVNLTRYDLMSPSVYAELGRNLFYSSFALQLVVVTLSGVSAGSDMITREVRGRTLGLLALTPLTPWRIVAGKWKAALIQTSTVLLCGAPVFAVCVFLGGVGVRDLAYSLTLSLLCASLAAAVAIYCSTLFRAGYVATIVSLISLVAYCALPPVVLFGLLDLEREGMAFLSFTHPLFASITAAVPTGFGGRYLGHGWIGATVVTSGLILLLLRGGAARVRLLIRRPGSDAPEAASLDDLGRTPAGRSPRIAALANLFRGRFGVWETNAILWKELSTRRIGGTAVRIGYLLLGFLLLTSMMFDRDWRTSVLVFSWCVLLLVAVANGVSLFASEREERKWDILLSTPLRSREIVFAKLVAGLAPMAPTALVLSVFWFLTGLYFNAPIGAAMMLASVLLAVLLAYLVGAFASLNAQSQRVAFSAAFGVLIGFLVVFPAVLGLLGGLRILPQGSLVESLIGMTNPGYHLAQFGDMLRSGRWMGLEDYRARRAAEMASTFQVLAPLYSAMIVGLIAWITVRFDRATGRA